MKKGRTLQAGDKVTIEVVASGDRYRSEVHTMGGAMVRLAAPVRRGAVVAIAPAESLFLWLTRPDALYGFATTARWVEPGSGATLVTDRPGAATRIQRRNHVREWMSIEPRAVLLHEEGGTTEITVLILNLSATGALVAIARSLPIGAQLWLTFALPGGGQVEAAAEVLRVEERGATRFYTHRLGLRFIHPRKDTAKEIVRAIFRFQADRRRKELRS